MKKIILAATLLAMGFIASAQDQKVIRIAKVTIDSSQLEEYKKLLKVQMETAVQKEPGVISYAVYADKKDPFKLTILEIYADNNAYLAHRETPHFLRYKSATKDMVKSLELSEVDFILSAKK